MALQSQQNRGDAPQDTLANMPSGTSFAQKARAAELNAARSRKKAAESHYEEEQVPDLGPVSLADFKIFRRRVRGKNKSHSREHSAITEEESPTRPSSPASGTQQQPPPIQAHQPSQLEHAEAAPPVTLRPHAALEQASHLPEQTHAKRTSAVSAYEQYLQSQAIAAANNATRTLTSNFPSNLQYSPPATSEPSSALAEQGVEATVRHSNDQHHHPVTSGAASHGQYPLSTPASSHSSSRQSSSLSHQARMQNEMAYATNAGMMGIEQKENRLPPRGPSGQRQFSGQYG